MVTIIIVTADQKLNFNYAYYYLKFIKNSHCCTNSFCRTHKSWNFLNVCSENLWNWISIGSSCLTINLHYNSGKHGQILPVDIINSILVFSFEPYSLHSYVSWQRNRILFSHTQMLWLFLLLLLLLLLLEWCIFISWLIMYHNCTQDTSCNALHNFV